MSLVQRVAELAARIGDVVATKIDATHPGLARAWGSVMALPSVREN